MPLPLEMVLPHRLGRAHAKAKVREALQRLATSMGQNSLVQHVWDGDRASWAITAFDRTATGYIDIGPDDIRIFARVPWKLTFLLWRLRRRIRIEAPGLLSPNETAPGKAMPKFHLGSRARR